MHDWQRAGEYLAGTWPKPFPTIYDVGTCPWTRISEFFDQLEGPLVIDT